jgi:hypothetical protein
MPACLTVDLRQFAPARIWLAGFFFMPWGRLDVVPLEVLGHRFSRTLFSSGWSRNPKIGYAKSLMDYLFRWLELRFLKPNMEFFSNSRTENNRKPRSAIPQKLSARWSVWGTRPHANSAPHGWSETAPVITAWNAAARAVALKAESHSHEATAAHDIQGSVELSPVLAEPWIGTGAFRSSLTPCTQSARACSGADEDRS